jgi:hypothetical protein
MAAPWYLDPDNEETLCACGHQSIEHLAITNNDDTVSFPCGSDERWVATASGGMELQNDGCLCEDYTEG